MSVEHFEKAAEYKGKLAKHQPEIDAAVRFAQVKRALADEFPELNDEELGGLAAEESGFDVGAGEKGGRVDPAASHVPSPDQSSTSILD